MVMTTDEALAKTQRAEAIAPVVESTPPTIQQRGRFALLRKLGEGGMGQVFAAYDEQLDRRVAIKLLHQHDASEDGRLRLLREAQALAKIAHPNVVTVFEVGQLDTDIFLAMEYVDGTTLQDWQDEPGRTIDEILAAYVDAGRGLAAVHEAGLVHRDFKPTNVMIGRDERVRILDFGLVQLHEGRREKIANIAEHLQALDSKLTTTGMILGTPAYMSPEQYLGDTVDARSDQFSFCIALYEAVYGQHPFGKTSLQELLPNLLEGKPLPPPPNNAVPGRVAQALTRGLSKDPAARFPDLTTLLEQLVEGSVVDLSEHSRQRRLFGLLLVLLGLLNVIRTIVSGEALFRSRLQLLIVGALAVVVVLGGCFFFRDTLLRNQFHRKLAIAIFWVLVAMFVSRVLGFVHETPGVLILQRDLMILCSSSLSTAVFCSTISRWSWLPPGLALATVVGMSVFPAYEAQIALVGFNAMIYGFVFTWWKMVQSGKTLLLEGVPIAGQTSRRLTKSAPKNRISGAVT